MKTSTYPLRVDDNGIYITRTVDQSICDYCGAQNECKIKAEALARCATFVPILVFSPAALKGLEGGFSTFRSSFIWYQRAKWVHDTGGRVAIVNSAESKVMSFAKITKAVTGQFHQLMADHAKTNHLLLGSGISDDEAPAWLAKQIRNLAGSRYVKSPEQICSVIYVKIEEQTPDTIAC